MAKKRSVPVREVGRKGVQMLRPFEWVATVFQSFRDRPLPATYKTEVQPVFDIFGSERVGEYVIETGISGLGGLEAFDSKCPGDQYRFYLSAACFHSDSVVHTMWFNRIVPDPVLGFPAIPFDAGPGFAFVPFQQMTTRDATLPPDGRMSARSLTMGAGARMFLTTMYYQYPIGEPSGDLR